MPPLIPFREKEKKSGQSEQAHDEIGKNTSVLCCDNHSCACLKPCTDCTCRNRQEK